MKCPNTKVDLKTLPDILDTDLRVLSIGLNPSLPSVAAGFYFANPRNRFWKALNSSTLLGEPVEPGSESMWRLLKLERIGFTDLVKRPTRGAAELRAQDYREGAPRLQALIKHYRPQLAWFHGKLAYRHFVRIAGLDGGADAWGLQPHVIDDTRIFVTPNPSPANAVFSLDELVSWYSALADCLCRLTVVNRAVSSDALRAR
jgi:TDG/mug DNA glycosylase family protein